MVRFFFLLLVIIDYYSNYHGTEQLCHTTSNDVINYMKCILARHGIPYIVQSDNGPQYSSHEFRLFAEQYGFKHTTSSPLNSFWLDLRRKKKRIVLKWTVNLLLF